MDEREIIIGLKSNDQLAFKYLVDQYNQNVIRTCLGLLQNIEDAEDIAQDVFVEVFQSIHSFRSDSSLSTWLYRIAVNKSLNLIKKNKKKQWLLNIESLFAGKKISDIIPSDLNLLPDEQLIKNENQAELHAAIESLTDSQKVAFTLNKYEDLSYKEISEVMKISLSSVESLIFRAKATIVKKMTKKST